MTQMPDVYEENGIVVYRASSLGGCVRSLVAARLGESATPPGQRLQAAMDESSAAEDRAIGAYEQATGHRVIGQQDEVELPLLDGVDDNSSWTIRGHIDGIDEVTGDVLEVKSLSQTNFDKWKASGIEGLGSLGTKYMWQAALYGHATGKDVRFVIFNKAATIGDSLKDEVLIIDPPLDKPGMDPEMLVPLSVVIERVHTVEEWVDRDEYPECDRNCRPGEFYSHIHIFPGVTLDSSGELDTLLEQYDEVVQRIKDDTDLKESLRERLVMEYGVGKHATGRFNLNVQRVMSSRFDTGLFKRKHPDMYDQFLTPSESVRVIVKKVGGDSAAG